MANPNNYTVSTLLATAQVSTTFTDDDFVPVNYAWSDPALIVTPDTGYVVSAENFTIGGSTPSATTTSPYTATFTHGVGGCTLPNSHITAVTFKNSSVAGSIGNVVVCELTTITGNFSGTPGATTALQVDIMVLIFMMSILIITKRYKLVKQIQLDLFGLLYQQIQLVQHVLSAH